MNDLLPYIHQQLNDTLGSLLLFKPELCLSILFLLVLVTDLLFAKTSDWLCRAVACGGLLLVLVADWGQYPVLLHDAPLLFNGSLIVHHSAVVLKLIIDFISILILLYFPWDRNLHAHRKGLSDAYSIIIASVLGLHLMVMSATLLTMFLSVEMVSIASYLLVAYKSENGFSAEASLKYVLFGMAASAVMLYGISLFYGFTGTINLFDRYLIMRLRDVDATSMAFALILILAGIGFKLSFVPLHFWVPDVYQGAATPVTAYLSTLPKIAAFGLLINFLTPFTSPHWQALDFKLLLSVIGVVSLIAGNFAAVWQQNVKRLLAYSSIGHTGFALMAIVTFTAQGITALNFYLAVYSIASIGTLALATFFTNTTGAHTLEDYSGLGTRYPIASVCFVVLLISLTGLPVTAGFNAKLLVFSSVYSQYQQSHNLWLLLLLLTGAVTTVVALVYYIKVPLYLFLRKTDKSHETPHGQTFLIVLSVLAALFVLFFGVFPSYLAQWM
ncbi:NADH-quinone oxidoreductase subunit N [Mucilaginibacter robiniae]|uniref:NADH-quinone oxidoreductase subunit N n=1 Tax=Mucilaginibacter robiniae TaxID=2728022 RepID=A0A7L5DU81_9SPHI|nr:NADH-quinone oxidoreductase subunit N [Mucilaginibacter robiniae]QJD94665.1 NADH-quinone oxidoreductase subunit N [Mucilaginibacter robiniae]